MAARERKNDGGPWGTRLGWARDYPTEAEPKYLGTHVTRGMDLTISAEAVDREREVTGAIAEELGYSRPQPNPIRPSHEVMNRTVHRRDEPDNLPD
jgi:hypothetical protein